MVRRQLADRGIRDRRVLAAMRAVPREAFVPPQFAEHAYDDRPLPIAEDQTISQPYIVATMLALTRIRYHDRVLEIGTGSGYQAAVLASMAREVWSVERIPCLAASAAQRLRTLGYDNVTVIQGDGAVGFADAAPYDAIVVAAAAPTVPRPLVRQLADGGRLTIPVGPRDVQDLLLVERHGADVVEHRGAGCRFVPLVSGDAYPA